MSLFVGRVPTLILAASIGLGPGPARAESVRVPGTRVWLEPPAGFSRADEFSGFQDAAHGASIVVTEIPGPASRIRAGMTLEGLESRGMDLIESDTVTVDEGEALLLHVSQRSEGTDYFKWMLVGGSEQRTYLIVGAFLAEDSDLSDAIRHSVLTASWAEEVRPGTFEGLPFQVDPAPHMRVAERMGNLVIFTESGRLAGGNPGAAVLIVGSSIGDSDLRDLVAYSKRRLMKTERLKGVKLRGDSSVVIDGLPGHELTAEGADAKSGRRVGVYQLLLADGKTYYIAQGFVARERFASVLPVFRTVTSSFRRVEAPRPKITN